ncbi:MAG: hypothetical protein QOE48_959 [Mycobacterium sp.]|jgi:hypothetical protein|nr:hypothetical protein [Mycobacterium sp.]MDT5276604.1 hypothetical protein [Mycobacterium sp.]MDT5305291.1 hypothetical protein [Mycobacterium sp.]
MTVLGAVVFGGLLALGVLWLLVTAPGNDVDQTWSQSQWRERADLADPAAGVDASDVSVLIHSSQS